MRAVTARLRGMRGHAAPSAAAQDAHLLGEAMWVLAQLLYNGDTGFGERWRQGQWRGATKGWLCSARCRTDGYCTIDLGEMAIVQSMMVQSVRAGGQKLRDGRALKLYTLSAFLHSPCPLLEHSLPATQHRRAVEALRRPNTAAPLPVRHGARCRRQRQLGKVTSSSAACGCGCGRKCWCSVLPSVSSAIATGCVHRSLRRCLDLPGRVRPWLNTSCTSH